MTNPFPQKRPNAISAKQRARLADLAKVRKGWWDEARAQGSYPICGICGEPIEDFKNLDSDHRIPGKMGGCKDNSPGNLQPAHRYPCNTEKGSQRKPAGKACPRRMGKLLSLQAAKKYWLGRVCACGEKKKARESLCAECRGKLREATARELENTQGEEYCRMLQESELEVLRWHPAESEKAEVAC